MNIEGTYKVPVQKVVACSGIMTPGMIVANKETLQKVWGEDGYYRALGRASEHYNVTYKETYEEV